MPYVDYNGIFHKDEFDKDVKELEILEDNPFKEVNPDIYQRLEELRYKVEQGYMYIEEKNL